MRIIGKGDTIKLLPMQECIEAVADVLTKLHKGEAVQYLRSMRVLPSGDIFGLMPGYLHKDGYFGAKVINVFHHNSQQGLPSHQGLVMLFDAKTGAPVALMDGFAITKIRTAAASAVATKLLANTQTKILALIGAGDQAVSHLEAMMCVRSFEEVRVYSRNPAKAQAFAQRFQNYKGAKVVAVETAAQAAKDADVICTLTPGAEIVLKGEYINPGAHINAVGACRPADRELDAAAVAKARLFGDLKESVFNESGDFLLAKKEGAIGDEHYLADIGALLCGEIQGRTAQTDVTMFESLGLALEDLASAELIFNKAVKSGAGTEVDF